MPSVDTGMWYWEVVVVLKKVAFTIAAVTMRPIGVPVMTDGIRIQLF